MDKNTIRMKRIFILFAVVLPLLAGAQVNQKESCTSIMVGKSASADGSVITSHTCDGRYRTWMSIEPAADHKGGDLLTVNKGTMHTTFRTDTTGIREAGKIPQASHTYAYLNTAYPCLNEKQLAIGETTFGGPDTLRNPKGMFQIEELQRIALQRCSSAREAILLIADLIRRYGYGDGGECITIADRREVWQMEILGEGKDGTACPRRSCGRQRQHTPHRTPPAQQPRLLYVLRQYRGRGPQVQALGRPQRVHLLARFLS